VRSTASLDRTSARRARHALAEVHAARSRRVRSPQRVAGETESSHRPTRRRVQPAVSCEQPSPAAISRDQPRYLRQRAQPRSNVGEFGVDADDAAEHLAGPSGCRRPARTDPRARTTCAGDAHAATAPLERCARAALSPRPSRLCPPEHRRRRCVLRPPTRRKAIGSAARPQLFRLAEPAQRAIAVSENGGVARCCPSRSGMPPLAYGVAPSAEAVVAEAEQFACVAHRRVPLDDRLQTRRASS